MKRLYLVWPTYALVASIATLGLVWLTVTTLQADHQRSQSIEAQQKALVEAERAKQALIEEQRINEALWLADSLVAPLLANEAAIPWQYFEPFLITSPSNPNFTCSPLMFQSSPIVKVHFQVDAAQQWQGPLYLTQTQSRQAIEQGVPPEKIAEAFESIDKLKTFCSFQALAQLTPPPTLSTSRLGAKLDQLSQLGNSESKQSLDLPPIEQQQGRSRQQAFNSAAVGSPISQTGNQAIMEDLISPPNVTRSPSRVVWLGNDLLQIRRINVDTRTLVQGGWLDWPSIETWLEQELQSSFPNVELIPVKSNESLPVPRQMVSLPVKLALPPAVGTSSEGAIATSLVAVSHNSAIAWSLGLAWFAFVAGVSGTAWILHSALSLSTRRATFVSAVTHELRTPLTTFQLYTDLLLARDDLDADKRNDYFKTLKSQSERLARLVENVLAYARLDGGKHRPVLESKPITTWLELIQPRLFELVNRYQAELIVVPCSESVIPHVMANQDMLEQLCLNLVENACKYGLTAVDRTIRIEWRSGGGHVEIDIVDHGPGIPEAFRRKLFQPFSRSAEQAAGDAPGIGLGLSLAKRLAKAMGGSLRWMASDCHETRFRISLIAVPSER